METGGQAVNLYLNTAIKGCGHELRVSFREGPGGHLLGELFGWRFVDVSRYAMSAQVLGMRTRKVRRAENLGTAMLPSSSGPRRYPVGHQPPGEGAVGQSSPFL